MGMESTEEKTVKQYDVEELSNQKLGTDLNYRHKYIWHRVFIHVALQLGWICGIYYFLFHAKLATKIWCIVIGFLSGQAVGLGAHRGYSHRSFKMTKLMQILFLLFQTVSGQNSMFTWVRDHKLHHKYSDTDADPHNSNRGFFFCHMGWLMVKPHPLLREKSKLLDLSELYNDKFLMFQYKYFLHIYFVVGFLIPVFVPVLFWDEDLICSIMTSYFCRYVSVLHATWSINSFAHLWGGKPYDKRINGTQSTLVWLLTVGDGNHNFHHSFPWDYRHSEANRRNVLGVLVDVLAWLGMIYDMKTASPRVIYKHMKKYGDGSYSMDITEKAYKLYESRDTQEPIPHME